MEDRTNTLLAAPGAASAQPQYLADASMGDLIRAALERFNLRRTSSLAASQQAVNVGAICW